MTRLNPGNYGSIVFFTGAGMSAESGVPASPVRSVRP